MNQDIDIDTVSITIIDQNLTNTNNDKRSLPDLCDREDASDSASEEDKASFILDDSNLGDLSSVDISLPDLFNRDNDSDSESEEEDELDNIDITSKRQNNNQIYTQRKDQETKAPFSLQ